jgi:hypothetical protein
MQKVCKYGNAVVYISIGEHSYENIRKSTEKFLRRVVKENQNGNSNTSRNICKKQVLD